MAVGCTAAIGTKQAHLTVEIRLLFGMELQDHTPDRGDALDHRE